MHTTISTRTRVLVGATAALAAAALILVIGASAAVAAGPNTNFAFDARGIGGAVALTGGGAFNSSCRSLSTSPASSLARDTTDRAASGESVLSPEM